MTEELSRHLVTWEDGSNGDTRYNRVILEAGHTTEDDIPRIIAVALGIPESDVRVKKVERTDGKYRRQFKPVPRSEGDAPESVPWV